MITVDNIPQKKANIHKLQGPVVDLGYHVSVGGVDIPSFLEKKFRRRCATHNSLQDAVDNKEIVLRGNDNGWFGLVSGEFQEYTATDVTNVMKDIGELKEIRYNPNDESFQVGYSIKEGRTNVMVYLQSGQFGVFGGNGESAVKLGVAISEEPTAWTLFQNNRDSSSKDRTIHRFRNTNLDKVVSSQLSFAKDVEKSWEESRVQVYSRGEVEAFAFKYLKRCSDVFSAVVSDMNGSVSGYDLASSLTKEAMRLDGNARLGLESIAGDVIMNPSMPMYSGGDQLSLF